MMQPTQVLTARNSQAPIRICSGACPFFEPVYDMGRKIAGTGACEKHRGSTMVRVGNACLWPRSEKPELAGIATAKRPRTAA